MGQKVHPKGLRIGIIKDWDAKWFATGPKYAELLHEDMKIRDLIDRRLWQSGISRVEIERAANRLKVTIHTAKPGMVIGRGGAGAESIKADMERLTGKQVSVNILEVRSPEVDAKLVAENIAGALEKRISFRRAVKQAVGRAMRGGAKGVRVIVSGRLGGAEIARSERNWEGTVPLHTLRADIDYGLAEARTTYGQIGVKVWIFRGEVLPGQERPADRPGESPRPGRRPARA
ncbi:MAG: 30S ribosomal protein S3 [bacterium]|nr:30S ribosomal protein S3 [bacterium]